MDVPWTMYLRLTGLFILLTLVLGYHYGTRGLARHPSEVNWTVPAAKASQGKQHLVRYGCGGCHVIPGVAGAQGEVGPRLDELHGKIYIAGVLPQSPQNLVAWIQNPRDIDPQTAMPDLGVGEQEARDMAAYLYSLR